MSLIDELKRRNVFRVAGAYLALGWVVTQVTATLTPAFNLPPSALALVSWIGVIGFPFVVLFAWVYELTPEGLKRESEVDRTGSITHVTARRLDYITIGIVGLGVLLFLFDRFSPRSSVPVVPPAVVALPTQDRAQGALLQEASTLAAAPDARSIAVLPFINMSSDKEQEYFSDGISEELLNQLARIPELQVSSRGSAFAFKGEKIAYPEIAQRLNVAHILEGSVRKSGNKVRITAQLIDARTDKHLWSDTYDRSLDDIFAVQDEIAGAVVQQLKIKLLGEAPKTRATNPEAYALFLQARELGRVFTPEAFEQSNAKLKRVLEIDPTYAAAWERLGTNYINEGGDILPEAQANEMAREAYRKALAIEPDLVAALDGIAWIEMFRDGDLAAAARDYTRVVSLAPANIDVISNASRLLICLGRPEQALAVVEHTALHDPANPLSHANLAEAYLLSGRMQEAIATRRTHVSLGSTSFGAYWGLGRTLLLAGDYPGALAATQREAAPSQRQLGLALIHHSLGQKAESDAAANAFIAERADDGAFDIAVLHAWRGQNDAAFEQLERAVVQHSGGLCGVAHAPLLRPLHDDPRWEPFLRRIGRAPEQLAAIEFTIKLPM